MSERVKAQESSFENRDQLGEININMDQSFNDAEVNDAGIANELVLDLPNNIAEHQSTDYVYQVEDQDYQEFGKDK